MFGFELAEEQKLAQESEFRELGPRTVKKSR